jgi:hypothetical protein
MDFTVDPHDRTADQAGFFRHQFYQMLIGETVLFKRQFLETGTAETKHLIGLVSLQNHFNLLNRKRILKKIPFVENHLLLQEQLPCFPAGGSLVPAEEIYGHMLKTSFLSDFEYAAVVDDRFLAAGQVCRDRFRFCVDDIPVKGGIIESQLLFQRRCQFGRVTAEGVAV